MSGNGSGWFSNISRIFTGTPVSNANNNMNSTCDQEETTMITKRRDSISNEIGKSTLNGSSNSSTSNGVRNIRYLSPSVLDSGKKTDAVLSTPSRDIFGSLATRKRQLVESTSPRSFIQTEPQGTAKRFRSMGGNFSLLEEPIRNGSERLDTTWAAGISVNGSPSSSIRSLRSRISDTTSVSSNGLSSKTRAILQQLEKVSTPAKETRRLPLMKPLDVISEKWAPLNSTMAPPLKKITSTVPSRMQLISSTAGVNQRKPYWRDILRKPKEPESILPKVTSLPGEADGSTVHPLFDVSSPGRTKNDKDKFSEKQSTVVPVLKGHDGRNVFNTKGLEEEVNTALVPTVTVPLPAVNIPEKGFIDDVVFSFAAPRAASFDKKATDTDDESDDDEDVSSDDSSLSDSDGSQSSDEEIVVKLISDKKDTSRPPTSADTDSSTGPSGSPPSSKSSPVNDSASASWDCPTCLVNNKGSSCVCCGHVRAGAANDSACASWDCPTCLVNNKGSSCVCCGHVRAGAAATTSAPQQKNLVSNLSSFAPKANSGFKFGFEAAKTTDNVDNKKEAGVLVPKTTEADKIVKPSVQSSVNEATGSANVVEEWQCPECFVSNKTDKCVCCGFVNKAVAKSDASSGSVFGDRAFKPASTGAFKFGLSQGGSKPPSVTTNNGALTETLANGTEKADLSLSTKTPSEFAANVFGATAKAPLFGVEQKTVPANTLFGATPSTTLDSSSEPTATQEKPSLFGSGSTSLFSKSSDKPGISSEAAKPAATNLDSSKSLFGHSQLSSTMRGAADGTSPVKSAVTADVNKPLFTGFGVATSKSLFGASTDSKDISTQPGLTLTTSAKPAVSMFGSLPSSGTATSNPSMFGLTGSTVTSTAAPAFGSSSVTTSIFGATAAPAPPSVSAPTTVFGSLAAPTTAPAASMFGSLASSSTATTSSTTAAAPTPLFGSLSSGSTNSLAVPSLSLGTSAPAPPAFGSLASSTKPVFNIGAPTPASSMFGAAPATGGSLFSAPKVDDAPPTKKAFGSTTSNNGSMFGNSSGFGGNTSTAGFGSFGSQAAPPVLPSSSSAGSLFSQPSNSAFNFGSTEAPSSFNFGGGSATDMSTVFGSGSQAAAPAPGGFAFGANPAPSAAGGAFAFNASAPSGSSMSSNSRKMVAARRRLPGRKP